MNIVPLGNRALLKPVVVENEMIKEMGLVIPDSVDQKEKPIKFTVEALGFGDDIMELGLQVGDVVIANKYAGTPVEFDGAEYKIVLSGDIQAKVI